MAYSKALAFILLTVIFGIALAKPGYLGGYGYGGYYPHFYGYPFYGYGGHGHHHGFYGYPYYGFGYGIGHYHG